MDVIPSHLFEAAALDDGLVEGVVGAVDDDLGDVASFEGYGDKQCSRLDGYTVALVCADYPVGGHL